MTSTSSSSADTLDVQKFIDAQPFSPYQWVVFVLCLLIMVADGFDTAVIGFVAPELTREWGVAKLALGPVLSASLIGMALGALVAGPAADRFGRKPVLLLAVLAFGLFSLASGYAGSITSLTAWRFLTGLGLGAATPIATTLLSESSPTRCRSLLLNGMFCGFTIGAAAGGFGAVLIIPDFGWRGVFIIGAAIPLVLALVAFFALRESVRFLVIRNAPVETVKAVLRRVTGVAQIAATRFVPESTTKEAAGSSVMLTLSPAFRVGTLMLWVTYFMGVLVFYLISSWLPTLIKDSGLTFRQASIMTAIVPVGGTLGAIAYGWLMDRMNPHLVVGTAYLAAGAAVWGLGQCVGYPDILPVLTFLTGFSVGGALVSMPSLAAAYYPTQGRASGVAWMLGIGRFGGIVGAMLGGVLMQFGLGVTGIMGLLAIPTCIGAAALFYKNGAHREQPVPAPVPAVASAEA
jgi:AAHS family 4-hydroxybenzoate transporter-like MFS transporter